MLILAFDTATPAVTVALHDGAQVVAHECAADARRHGELLAVFIDKVLHGAGADRASLTAVAVGTGPGPYTGLRTGLVTARVLGAALGIRVDGICTLDVIAADAAGHAGGRDFLVATDARRKELYWGRYRASGQRLSGPEVSKAAELPTGLPVAGEGAAAVPGAGRPSASSRDTPTPGGWPAWPPTGSPPGRRPRPPSRSTCAAPMPGSPAARSE